MFQMNHPFIELPHEIASPHNSESVRKRGRIAYRRPAENSRLVLIGDEPHQLIVLEERMR
jgi:hypothetical protein